jgi:hypothetical protein
MTTQERFIYIKRINTLDVIKSIKMLNRTQKEIELYKKDIDSHLDNKLFYSEIIN